MNSNNNFTEVRHRLYEDVYHAELQNFNIDLRSWKHPYTKLKSFIYLELGALLTFLLLKTNIKPNSITTVYASLGFIAAVLISFGNDLLSFIAIIIWFLKAIPDWIDGHIARLKDLTSHTGALLDSWGAHVNVLCFQVGIALFVAQSTDNDIYYLLAIAILLSSSVNLRYYYYQHTAEAIPPLSEKTDAEVALTISTIQIKIYIALKNILNNLRYNGRSRYTDFVLLVIFLEIIYDKLYFSFVLVWIWATVNVLYFLYSFKKVISN